MSGFKKIIQKQKNQKEVGKKSFNLEAKIIADRGRVVACPCNPSNQYKDCCEPIHNNIYLADTPEKLMRSRYSAFVLANTKYLLLSNHSSTRLKKYQLQELKDWTTSVRWLKLEVLHTELISTSEGVVAFKAHYLNGLNQETIQEKSFFVKENNHWVYIDGTHY